MGSQHRYADAGDAHPQAGLVEYLAGLLDDLLFFDVAAGAGIDRGVVAEDVEGARFREDFGRGVFTGEHGTGLHRQLSHGGGTGAGGRLVGRYHHALDAEGTAQRIERGDQDDGRTVRVGDDAPGCCVATSCAVASCALASRAGAS